MSRKGPRAALMLADALLEEVYLHMRICLPRTRSNYIS